MSSAALLSFNASSAAAILAVSRAKSASCLAPTWTILFSSNSRCVDRVHSVSPPGMALRIGGVGVNSQAGAELVDLAGELLGRLGFGHCRLRCRHRRLLSGLGGFLGALASIPQLDLYPRVGCESARHQRT